MRDNNEHQKDEESDRAPRFAYDADYQESNVQNDDETQVFDIASYMNMSGGKAIVLGRVKIMKHMNNQKVLKFIERV